MRRVKTEKFIRQMEMPGSAPGLYECSDDETWYIKRTTIRNLTKKSLGVFIPRSFLNDEALMAAKRVEPGEQENKQVSCRHIIKCQAP